MRRRVLWVIVTALVMVVMIYLSRFWVFDLWGREGLFGLRELQPQGGLLAGWLRGTPLAPFELILWMVGGFLVLTWLEKAFQRFGKGKK